MNKLFALRALLVLLSLISGCCIPTGEEILGETVIGERKAQDGKVSEQILKVKGLQNIYCFISPEGCGVTGHQSFEKFYIKKGENKIYLPYLHFDLAEEIGYPILPVRGSTKWLAAREAHFELFKYDRFKVDMELIVFDEKRIYRKLVVNQCVKTKVSQEINYHGMTFENGYRKVTFHTYEGDYIFDVINNKFEKK